MAQLVIADLDEAVLERLRRRAAEHARSAEVEARDILAQALSPVPDDSWSAINAMREELARSGRDFPDSTPLVREDRGR